LALTVPRQKRFIRQRFTIRAQAVRHADAPTSPDGGGKLEMKQLYAVEGGFE
jgi:hypothetical protein